MSLLRNKVLVAVSWGHLALDLLASIPPVLLAFLSVPLGLTNAQVGLAASFFAITGSLSQPLFGYLADRHGARWFAVGGLSWVALWTAVAGVAPSYGLLLVAFAMAGLGSGAYHPQGAMSAFLSAKGNRNSSMSIWSLGGGIGFALGPALAGWLFEITGQRGMLIFAVLVLPVVWLLSRHLPRQVSDTTQAQATAPVRASSLPLSVGMIVLFSLLLFTRSWTYTGTNTYIPKLYASLGYSSGYYGSLLSGIFFALALGGLAGGVLADRWGAWRLIAITLALSTPCFLGFLWLPAPWRILFGVLAGFFLGASQSPSLVIAQQIMPKRAGLAAGLVQGFTFVSGALATSASGVVADRIGLLTTLRGIVWLPLLGAALSFYFARRPEAPGRKKQ